MNTTLTIDQVTEKYLAERSISPISRRTYKAFLTNFWMWCSANRKDKHSLTAVDLQEYRQYVIENYSGKYSTSLIRSVKIFFTWMAEHRHMSHNPTSGLKLPKQANQFLKEPLNEGEVLRLLGLFDRRTPKSRRDYLIIRLMLIAGLRCVEVSRINIGDIQTKRGIPVINIQRKGHNTKDDFIAVEQLYKDIEAYMFDLDDHSPELPLFASTSPRNPGQRLTPEGVGKVVSKYFDIAGIKSKVVTPHSLRHTAAVTCIRNNISLDEIQMFLGHTRQEITKIYTKYANIDIKLKNKPGNFLAEYYEKLIQQN